MADDERVVVVVVVEMSNVVSLIWEEDRTLKFMNKIIV